MYQEKTTALITISEIERLPQVIQVKEKIAEAILESKEVEIVQTNLDLQTATNLSKGFSQVIKKSEQLREETKKPYLQGGKDVDTFFKKLVFDAVPEMNRLDKMILAWNRKQQKIAEEKAAEERRIAEEKAIQEAIEKEELLKKNAVANGQNPDAVKVEVAIIPEVVAEEKKLSTANTSGVGTMRHPKWELIDINLVPREYLTTDDSKITAHRKASGVTAKSDIPGIRFYFEEGLQKR